MLPVAVLPICGILMGIGYLLCPASMQGKDVVGFIAKTGYFLVKAGGAIIDNMAILFVIGVSLGMSDDNHGSACLAGLVSWLVVTTLLSPAVVSELAPKIEGMPVTTLGFSKIQNPFIGILCGIIGAESYNRFKNMKLPDVFAFFSGRRFVAGVSMLLSLGASLVLMFVWPVLFNALVAIGKAIISIKGAGVGIFMFLNRLLIPTGLHHALNNVFWFDTIGIGDLTKFWSGSDGTGLGWSLGMYMSGFFPAMMFGVPGAAFAMYKCASNKKKAHGILLSVALCSFIGGVTEPFEFLFVFTAFPLYVAYAFLYAVIGVITYYSGFRAGFSFSAGATDLLFSASLPAAAKTWMIIPLGLLSFFLFYFVFKFMITKFNYKTPGREDDALNDIFKHSAVSGEASDDKFAVKAREILAAVGGEANVERVDCCATRLRFDLKDSLLVNEAAAKAAGAIAAVKIGKNAAQVIVGVTVQQVCDEMKKLLDASPSSGRASDQKTALPALEKTEVLSGGNHRTVQHGDSVTISQPESADGESAKAGEYEFSYVITDPVGIHARPAGELAKLMKEYDCQVTVSANEKTASAKSVIELMSLGVTKGTKVTVHAKGNKAAKSAEAAKRFFEERL